MAATAQCGSNAMTSAQAAIRSAAAVLGSRTPTTLDAAHPGRRPGVNLPRQPRRRSPHTRPGSRGADLYTGSTDVPVPRVPGPTIKSERKTDDDGGHIFRAGTFP